MVLLMNTVCIGNKNGSIFLNNVYLLSLMVYESGKSKGGKILAVTVKHGLDLTTDASVETVEIPVKSLYDNEDIITKFMIGVNKVLPNSRDAIYVDDILGEMLAK